MEVRGRVTDEAARGWDRYATAERVTITALLEAMGLELAKGWRPPQRIAAAATKIDRERRSR